MMAFLAKVARWGARRFWKLQYDEYRARYDIAPDVVFNGPDIRFYGDGSLVVGKGTHIGSYSTIQLKPGRTVTIGKNCRISHNVRLYTGTDVADQDLSQDVLRRKEADIQIGNHVWIGVNVYIGPGVTIGDNAVVGANAVVSNEVPPQAIVGGVPARLIKMKRM